MSNLNNPSAVGKGTERFGPESANAYRPFLKDVVIAAGQTAPASPRHCAVVGMHRRVAFLVIPPAGVTAYTVQYGRWVEDTSGDLNTFLVVGSLDVTVADTPTAEVVFETFTDPVAAFVTDLTGTPDADTTFKLFHRGA